MTDLAAELSTPFLPHRRLQDLLDALGNAGYSCVGPTLKDGAIVFEPVTRISDMPRGVTTVQTPGHYRVVQHPHGRRFSWTTGPQALKPYLFTPSEVLWRAKRDADGHMVFESALGEVKPLAIIGARACDIAALELYDKHFLRKTHPDPAYAARRRGLFIVAVNCSHPAETCFCVSTGDGPQATKGYDLALTELDDGYLMQASGERGTAIVAELELTSANADQLARAQAQNDVAARQQTRSLPSRNLRAALFANLEHPRWAEVADRCLSCGNCTSVCPTCFCHTEAEVSRLSGAGSEHKREWDSCFAPGHSYMHGFVVRPDTRTRYRQWLTHKLGGWHDQYERSGCVGCGRCIAWCPVGIDITEEATVICGNQT